MTNQFFVRWPSGRFCRFRSLSWAEFKKYERALQYRRPADVYLDIYRACVLEGPIEEELTAGIVNYVGTAMMDANPFGGKFEDVKRAVDLKRYELQTDFFVAAKAVIASLFHYSFEEIDTWDSETFFERVAMAEFVSGRKLEPGDPNKKKKRQAAQKRPPNERQQMVLDRVDERERERDRQMPTPDSEYRSESEEKDPPKLRRKDPTTAQRMVQERMRKAHQ